MAVFKGKSRRSKRKFNQLANDPLWLYLLGITSLSFLLADSSSSYLLASLLLTFSLISIYVLYFRQGRKLHDKVLQQLGDFDNQFTIISSVELQDGSKKGYFDYIVLSPKGIFNIRILDFEGTMTGFENDEFWDYIKITSPYDVTKKRVKNPLNFLQHSHRMVETLLEKHHIKYIPLQSVFVVNSSDALLETDSTVPIIRVKKLKEYIEGHRNRANMVSILRDLEDLFLSGTYTKYKTSSLTPEI